jgi:hypothetical protein
VFAVTLSGVAVAVAIALVIARGAVAQSGTTARAPAPGDAGSDPAELSITRFTASVLRAAPIDAGTPAAAITGVVRIPAPAAGSAAAGRAPSRPAPAHRPGDPARAARPGELAIIVKPWAMIWLNGKPSGQTPFRAPVPAGRYRVRLVNDDVAKDETATVVVEPGQTATVERSW